MHDERLICAIEKLTEAVDRLRDEDRIMRRLTVINAKLDALLRVIGSSSDAEIVRRLAIESARLDTEANELKDAVDDVKQPPQ